MTNHFEKHKTVERSFKESLIHLRYKFGIKSDAYRYFLGQTEDRSKSASLSFAHYAKHDKDISAKEKDSLRLLEYLGDFVNAQHEINSINKGYGRLDSQDFHHIRQLKESVLIPFNHRLKEVINNNPNTGINELTESLVGNFVNIYSQDSPLGTKKIGDTVNIASTYIEQAANGMRHELATETMLDTAGIEYDYRTSTYDDKHGTDLYVKIDDEWHGIDIKASLTGETNARSGHKKSMAIYTGLRPTDFDSIAGGKVNTLSISYETAKEKSKDFVDRLRNMISGSKHLGKHATSETIEI